jgi:C4-dicarboxylate-binding protein DctP
MSAEEQGIISQAMKTAMAWQWKEQPVEVANALTKLRTLMTVNDITPANKELFIKQTRGVYAQFEPSIGKDFLASVTKALS